MSWAFSVKLPSGVCHKISGMIINLNIGSGNGLVPSGNKPLLQVNQCWSSSMMPGYIELTQGSHRVWKPWKNKVFFLEKSWKVIELRKSHTDKLSPSIRNLALISFASHLVSCILSNTSDYELLGDFFGLLLLTFNLSISLIYNSMILCKLYIVVN